MLRIFLLPSLTPADANQTEGTALFFRDRRFSLEPRGTACDHGGTLDPREMVRYRT